MIKSNISRIKKDQNLLIVKDKEIIANILVIGENGGVRFTAIKDNIPFDITDKIWSEIEVDGTYMEDGLILSNNDVTRMYELLAKFEDSKSNFLIEQIIEGLVYNIV